MNHSFNVEIATEYGLNEAILLENIYFWTKKNIANGEHFYDGLYWTYNSIKAFNELFPYLTPDKVRGVFERLIKKGLLKAGNYNKSAYDRTKWYALTEKAYGLFGDSLPTDEKIEAEKSQMHLGKSQMESGNSQIDFRKIPNRFAENPKPIPDINTDINQIENTDTGAGASASEPIATEKTGAVTAPRLSYTKDFEAFWQVYPRREEKAGAYRCWQTRLKDGYSPSELILAAERYAEACRRAHTEKRFIKQAKTFIGANTPFLDYLPTAQEMQEPAYETRKPDDDLVQAFLAQMGG